MKPFISISLSLFSMLFIISGCDNKEKKKYSSNELLQLTVIADTAASNASYSVKLIAVLLKESDNKEVIFSATSGTFQGSSSERDTVFADAKNTAIAYWTPDKTVDPVFFTITIKGVEQFSVTEQLLLTKVYPDSIFIYTNMPIFYKDSSYNPDITIDAYLHKAIGKLTTNLPFRFKAYQKISNTDIEIGNFTNSPFTTTDSTQQLSRLFRINRAICDTNYPVLVSGYFTGHPSIPVNVDTIYFLNKP